MQCREWKKAVFSSLGIPATYLKVFLEWSSLDEQDDDEQDFLFEGSHQSEARAIRDFGKVLFVDFRVLLWVHESAYQLVFTKSLQSLAGQSYDREIGELSCAAFI